MQKRKTRITKNRTNTGKSNILKDTKQIAVCVSNMMEKSPLKANFNF